jgi:hypothetical protein
MQLLVALLLQEVVEVGLDTAIPMVFQLLVDLVEVAGQLTMLLFLFLVVLVLPEFLDKAMLVVTGFLLLRDMEQAVAVAVQVLLDCWELHKLHREMVEQELLVI